VVVHGDSVPWRGRVRLHRGRLWRAEIALPTQCGDFLERNALIALAGGFALDAGQCDESRMSTRKLEVGGNRGRGASDHRTGYVEFAQPCG